MKKIVVGFIAFLFILVGAFFTLFTFETSAVSRDTTPIEFDIKVGETYLTIANRLKEENLIKSELFYKLFIRLTKSDKLEAGKYELSESMSVSDIVKVFMKGNTYNNETVSFTIPEGKHLENIAQIISGVTNYTEKELLSSWNDKEFINQVIDKYWFVTDSIKATGIRYALEGYLYPDTYEIYTNSSIEEIAYKMLDKMDKVLTNYKIDIEKSEYNIHEILTMASIIEHEAILDEDRKVIASVFYNRLEDNMKLQSCATIGYAIDEWKLTYSSADLKVDSPYNTYYYSGLPVGPGNMPSVKSIEAALYPSETDYLYFLANVCDTSDKKTYFSKTYDEHVDKKNRYLTCVN